MLSIKVVPDFTLYAFSFVVGGVAVVRQQITIAFFIQIEPNVTFDAFTSAIKLDTAEAKLNTISVGYQKISSITLGTFP